MPRAFGLLSRFPPSLTRVIGPGVLAACIVGFLTAASPARPAPRGPDRSARHEPNDSNETPDSIASSPLSLRPLFVQQWRHLHKLGVDRWHAGGFRGQGVRIAVLDSGFRGYHTYLGKALPAKVMTRSFRFDGDLEAKNSQHGIWCAAVLHTLAPDAEILLANWEPENPDAFLKAVDWARHEGARVVSCSVIMPSWSDGEGGGGVDEALGRLVGSGAKPADVLFFASAGNIAQRHWFGMYQDAGNGFHAWQGGQVDEVITPWGGSKVSVEVCWQPGPDFHVMVWDTVTGRLVGQSLPCPERPRTSAVVMLDPQDGHSYRVRVRLASGQPGAFHLSSLGGGLSISTPRGSIPCPADAASVVAVGAVDDAGARQAYSSCGPNSKLPKPDLVAPVPFQGWWRHRPFSGTSAAAPQAAGLAALWFSRHPDWNPGQVRQAMRDTAHDLGAPGHDFETGYGLITLPKPEPKVAETAKKR